MTAAAETTAPALAEAPEVNPRRWAVLGVLCFSLLVIGIDNTILNVAIPTISRDLGATSGQLQWMIDSYTLIFAGLLLVAGSLGDRFGRKGALAIGLLIFGAGSVLSALTSTPGQLIVTRGIMGIGAAFIMPTTLSIITNVFPASERPKAIAVWAGFSALGIAIGPVTGGFLLEHFWWGSVFLVNVPVVIVALVLGHFMVPTSKDPAAPRVDWVGAALSVTGLVTVVYAIIEAPGWGWTSPRTLGTAALGAVVVTAFVAWERRCAEPMLDVTVFKNRRFSGASIAITLVFFAMLGSMFLNSQYLQFVLGYDALSAGLAITPVALSIVVFAQIGIRLAARIGTRPVVALGFLGVAASMLVLATVGVDSGYTPILVSILLLGAGMGTAMSPATESIMSTLPKAKAGVGSAVNDTTRQIGGALGVAVLGSVFASYYVNHLGAAVTGLPPEAAQAARDSIAGALHAAQAIGGERGGALAAAAMQAFVDAKNVAVVVGAVVAGLGAVVAAVFLPSRARPGDEDASGDADLESDDLESADPGSALDAELEVAT
ncbi:MAG: MFS transporter [Acidimicrobiia bacterium]